MSSTDAQSCEQMRGTVLVGNVKKSKRLEALEALEAPVAPAPVAPAPVAPAPVAPAPVAPEKEGFFSRFGSMLKSPSKNVPVAVWTRKNVRGDDDPTGWTQFSQGDSKKLEAAFIANAQWCDLGFCPDGIQRAVTFCHTIGDDTLMMQYQLNDQSKQRIVTRECVGA